MQVTTVNDEPPHRVLPLFPEQERTKTALVGMIIFLASWAMMFGALFYSYALLRIHSPVWPPEGVLDLPIMLPMLNTAVLLGSSLALQRGIDHMRDKQPAQLLRWLLVTIALGLGFVGLQGLVSFQLWHDGLLPSSGGYGSIFYFLTAFHGLHVLVGLAFLCSLLPGARRQAYTLRHHLPVRIVSMFWHFVDTVWLLIFLLVYVL